MIWRAHPAAEEPGRAMAACVLVLVVGVSAGIFASAYGGTVLEAAAWSVGAIVIQLLSLHRYFFPSRFRIDEKGITARYLTGTKSLPWSRIRRFVCDDRGGYLSTRVSPGRFDAFRGLQIYFGSCRQEVVARIRDHLNQKDRDGTRS